MPTNKKEAILRCGCCRQGCCEPRCEPLRIISVGDDLVEVPGDCANPIPETLYIRLTGTPTFGDYTCFSGDGTIVFKTPLSGGTFCWEGTLTGSCLDCNGATFNWSFTITLCCSDLQGRFIATLAPNEMLCPPSQISAAPVIGSCNPVDLSGCFPRFGGCWVSCLDDVTPFDPPFWDVCFEISETPFP